MTVYDDDGRAGRRWSDWPKGALVLIAAGVVLPPVVARTGLIWPPLVVTIGLAVVAAGVVLFVVRVRRDVSQLVDVLHGDVRNLADRLTRAITRVETMRSEVGAVVKIVDVERRNLGMVASGLGEMRQILQLERQNLGLVAAGVDELRTALRSFRDELGEARGEAQEAVSRLDEVLARTGTLLARQQVLDGEVGVQRRNLGLVAGALDDVRRSAAGVHLFDMRQAAFEDALIQIADRIDQLDGDDRCAADSGEKSADAPHLTLPESGA